MKRRDCPRTAWIREGLSPVAPAGEPKKSQGTIGVRWQLPLVDR